jgi:hypothetical protein
MLSENDQKVIKFLKAQRLFIPDRIRYAELTDMITKFESGKYSSSMSEEQLPHKVWLNVQMALGGYFEGKE